MYKKPSKKVLLAQRIIIFSVMVLSIAVILIGTVLFTLGYRLSGGGLEQGALVQFDSRPSNARVWVDGRQVGMTATKHSVVDGSHDFLMSKEGYRDWMRSLTLEAGTLTWLDYVRLVPTELDKYTVRSYDAVVDVETAPDLRTIVVQESRQDPTFDIVDISDREVRSQTVSLPSSVVSAGADGDAHQYHMTTWDADGRYLLVSHRYGDTREWIVFDTENASRSANITRSLSLNLSDVQFASTSGTLFYGLSDGVIRKLDLQNETISRGLVSRVSSFDVFDNTIVTYLGTNADGDQIAGLYRDGDANGTVLRTSESGEPLAVATSRFYNDNYVAISEGLEVTVLTGRYPSAGDESLEGLRALRTFTAPAAVDQLSFSPDGDYVFVRAGLSFLTYENEYDRLNQSQVETSQTAARQLNWLDDHYLSASYDGHLSMRDFTGENVAVIMPIVPGFDATLSQNGRYIYGMNKTDETFRLERVTMILE